MEFNALADDDDAGVEHPVNVRVVAVCRNLAEIYRELALAEPAFSPEYGAEAHNFSRAADRFAEHGPLGYPAEYNRSRSSSRGTVRRVKAARSSRWSG